MWKPWFWPAFFAVLALDQITKYWVTATAHAGTFPDWIQLRYNPGIAWSLFDRYPSLVALSTLALIPILTWVWWRWYRPLGRTENLTFGLILGGALGNGIDRVVLTPLGFSQGVRDFIHVDLGFWPLNPWPTFNIADSGISIGFTLLILSSLRHRPVATGAAIPAENSIK